MVRKSNLLHLVASKERLCAYGLESFRQNDGVQDMSRVKCVFGYVVTLSLAEVESVQVVAEVAQLAEVSVVTVAGCASETNFCSCGLNLGMEGGDVVGDERLSVQGRCDDYENSDES